ncbi:ATP-binding protein [Streptomyces sp. NPDC006326]|uniref:ATP-binding protein n=1 Tax=Streptomyces sp. NPDC006326 TaxID=3156752 RepID=UPI0033B7F28B
MHIRTASPSPSGSASCSAPPAPLPSPPRPAPPPTEAPPPAGSAPAGPAPAGPAAPCRSFARWAARPTAATVPLVRARVRAVLEGWEVDAEAADLLLLAVSELVSNVVQHAAAPGRMCVGVTLGGGWLQLRVADRGAGLPRLPHPAAEIDPDAESGRGLLMLRLLAVEAGGELTLDNCRFGASVRLRIPVA